ncbi:helix-turn-helix transcriptional regulator [Paraclostridium sordellii]|uniref:helix-turn-helix transcriptional regulator n=1 Tax=Paraclostridium sordellii TaxID=1505 RepID=UPI003A84B50A
MLKLKRKSLRLSQRNAAKLLNISRNTLSSIENKKCTDLHLDLANRICKLYRLDLDNLINWLKSK